MTLLRQAILVVVATSVTVASSTDGTQGESSSQVVVPQTGTWSATVTGSTGGSSFQFDVCDEQCAFDSPYGECVPYVTDLRCSTTIPFGLGALTFVQSGDAIRIGSITPNYTCSRCPPCPIVEGSCQPCVQRREAAFSGMFQTETSISGTWSFVDTCLGQSCSGTWTGATNPRALLDMPFESPGTADGVPTCQDNCPYHQNLSQANLDGDRFGDACDCRPADPAVSLQPGIQGLTVGWNGVNITLYQFGADYLLGSSTNYDVVRGSLSALHAGGYPGGATCVANNLADEPYTEAAASCPAAPGDGCWYLVRAQNVCGTGVYRASDQPMTPPHPLDTSSPCP